MTPPRSFTAKQIAEIEEEAANLTTYEFDVTEIALARYTIRAESEEAARARFARGSYDTFHDLGHESPEVMDVRVLS